MTDKSSRPPAGPSESPPRDATSGPSPSDPPGPARQEPRPPGAQPRFVISHLTSVHVTDDARSASRDRFDQQFARALAASVRVVSESPASSTGRRVLVVEGELSELKAKAAELSPETVIEPALPRIPATARPRDLLAQLAMLGASPPPAPGAGATIEVTLRCDGEPVAQAQAVLGLDPIGGGVSTSIGGVSSAAGAVNLSYDAKQWRPGVLFIEPRGGAWSVALRSPASGITIDIPRLPRSGPLGWWHLITGARPDESAPGRGIKIGIVDTGVGPHPYLEHVHDLGAFIDGARTGPGTGLDVQNHGTHVAGIIGARPAADSHDFIGLAHAAELYAARVFTATEDANQGDIAAAVDALAGEAGVDLINLSLAGPASLIEQDAIVAALGLGTLCICAAGNFCGAPVAYPAAYPQSVAVSAVGLFGAWPSPSAAAAWNVPTTPGMFAGDGLFLTSFSNIGPQLLCAAPGNGIISTVPSHPGGDPSYADMSGTSMSAPLTCAALAVLLSRDPVYATMARDTSRSLHARALLVRHARSIGLVATYQGFGLARATGG